MKREQQWTQNHYKGRLLSLVREAKMHGVELYIERQPMPRPAMGHYITTVDAGPTHEVYRG